MLKPIAINPKTIRAENRRKILRPLIRKRELTIMDISWELKISVPTVSKNIGQLIAEGIAQKAGFAANTVGRRPMLIKFFPVEKIFSLDNI
jgi:predicted ArsR family transcriptional regulator